MTHKTILLVDDDDDFLTLLHQRCAGIGLNVVSTRNLLSATMSVARRVPDIVCVDVEMPTGSGLEFCEELAADAATAWVPIVVLSGKNDADTQRRCERLKAPFVPKTLDYWQVLEPLLRELSAETAKSGGAQKVTAAQTDSDVESSFAPKTLLAKNSAEVERKQIVIADDDQDMLQLLSERFSSCGHSVVGVDNALDAINMIHHVSPDLVCIDIGMPSGNGLSVCEMMASDEELRKIPIIVLTGRSDGETIRRCHDLLVYYVQKSGDTWDRVAPLAKELLTGTKAPRGPAESTDHSPADTSTKEEKTNEPDNLMDAVFAALASAGDDEGQKDGFGDPSAVTVVQKDVPWILCIDDDADFSDALRIRLENHGVAVVRAFNGMDGYRLAFTSPASAILLDYHMPNGEGDYILGRLKDNLVTKNIPVFMITGNQDRVLQRRMLAMGAADFLVKPLDFDDLRERLAKYIDILALQRGRQFTHAGKGVT